MFGSTHARAPRESRASLQILTQKIGLSSTDCFHEMCRLLGKVNAAYQLSELVPAAAGVWKRSSA